MLFVLIVVAAVFLYVHYGGGGAGDALVVYCAHDSIYSEQVLRQFEADTGIRVEIKFDTEATKSLGLVEQIIREREQRRCDVFWNNEPLGTMRLAEEGLLEPYQGRGYRRIPQPFKDPSGYWAGFAARMRVWVVNTDVLEATPEAVADATAGDLSRVAIARPLYGTTRMHYTVLWDYLGPDALQAWHADWRERGVNEVAGNATVKNLVASGACDLGLTDTDDVFVALDDEKPVDMTPYRLDDGRAIVVPNTVAIIAGTDKPEQAALLADYLLSGDVELMLAQSKSRQVPIGGMTDEQLEALPDDVRRLRGWAREYYPIDQLSGSAAACLDWLRSEYVQ